MAQIANLTCFLFENQAEAAAKFYTSVFDGTLGKVTHWPMDSYMAKGDVLAVEFSILGRDFVAVNCGGPVEHTDGMSIQILCDTQEELDLYWDKLLSDGGEPVVCGWIKDQFGVRWEVTPRKLLGMIGDPDQEKAARTMKAMMGMKKLDFVPLEKAYQG